MKRLSTKRVTDSTYQIQLTMNSFHNNNEYYLRTHDTAMGTRMALLYANLFKGKLEQEFLVAQNSLPREWGGI